MTPRPLFRPARSVHRRRPSDAAVALLALAVVVVLGAIAVPPSGIEASINDTIDTLPGFLDPLWRLVGTIALFWAVWVTIVALVTRRADLLRDVTLTLVISAVAASICNEVVGGDWGHAFAAVNSSTIVALPSVWLCVAAGVVAVVDPATTHSPRRIGRWCVGMAALAILLLGTATLSAIGIALMLATMSAAVVHLLLGTDAGLPDVGSVREVLADLGVDVSGLEIVDVAQDGVVHMVGSRDDDRPIRVLVVGRDATNTQLLAKAWRLLWYRQGHMGSLGRAHQMEHRAFVLLWLGARAGIAVPEVLAAGTSHHGDAVLALPDEGRRLGELAASEVTDELWASIWDLVDRMHRSGIVHGDLSSASFVIDDRGHGPVPVLMDLGTAAATTEDAARSIDLAQLLVLGDVLVGADRSWRAARASVGDDALRDTLPYLQPAALGSTLRDELSAIPRAERPKFDDLRDAAAAELAVDAPVIAGLRRVSGGALLRLALLGLIAYAVITAVSHVDVAEVWHELANAEWKWVVLGLFAAQVAIATNALVTQGAAPRRLAYGPLILLQFTIAFIALAIPSSAARVATVVRFFQKQGTSAASAAAISLVDSVSGFIAQVTILLLVLAVGIGDVHFDLSASTSSIDLEGLLRLLAIFAVAVVIAALVAVAVPRFRHGIVDKVRPWLGDMKEILFTLREPGRLVHLFGGSLLVEAVYACALGVCVIALGGGPHITMAEMLVVYIGAALFGGFMPVPGGIGVMEAALAAGLQAAGIDATTAFGAAVLFRLLTFFLPPIWGYAAFSWLQKSGNM